MSSITGNSVDSPADNALQLAPLGDDGPDFNAINTAFQKAVTDSQPYVDQCRLNYETRYAIWNGQSADGKKHSREGSKIDPTPWDGASDLRVYLADNIINKKVAMMCMAAKKANLVAVPVEGNDIKRAKVVSSFLKWVIQTQMADVDREIELLANYLNEKGVAATGQFWEVTQEKTLTNVSLEDFQRQFPQMNMQAILEDGSYDDDICALFEEIYGCSRGKARKMVKELKLKGETSVPTVGKEKGRPVMRAFNLDNDLFIPPFTTDIEEASGIYRVQYFTPERLRSFANTEGWGKDWVDKAIEKCRGTLVTITPTEYMQPLSRSFVYQQQRFTDMIGVVFSYQRLSDEDGVPGIYLTIFSPHLPPDTDQPGYAKFGLLGYAHGQYPFVIHRREYLSRKINDSRGIPEPIKPLQDQIKAHKDSRIDAASVGVLPPLCHPIGRPPTRWGPGAHIPERRPNEYHYADRPIPDMNTDDSEDRLANNAKEYVGFANRDEDPAVLPLENQFEIDKFLSGLSKAYRQVWHLWKQYGPPEVFFRVIGLRQADPTLFDKGDKNEDFDLYLSWDVQSLDFAQMSQKLSAIIQAVQTLDRNGTADYSELLQVVCESIDPNLAERILQPASVGTQQIVNDEQGDLAQLFAGINKDIKPGTPPQLGLQVMQNWLQAPDVQQKVMADEALKGRVEARLKQYQFAIVQSENARIGRLGASMPGPTLGQ